MSSLLLVIGVWNSGGMLTLVATPGATFDGAMFNFDQDLGIRIPSFVFLMRRDSSIFSVMTYLSYIGVPLVCVIFDVFNRRSDNDIPMTMRFLISGLIGFPIYFCVPAAGPYVFTSDYYNHLMATDGIAPRLSTITGIFPENCIPSLHCTWAYFFMWNAKKLDNPAYRAFFYGVGGLVVLGALTTGEHWFLDIVIAVPFAFCLDVAFNRRTRDSLAAILCGAVALAWFIAIRSLSFIELSPLAAWTLIALTIVSPVIARAISGRLALARRKPPTDSGLALQAT